MGVDAAGNKGFPDSMDNEFAFDFPINLLGDPQRWEQYVTNPEIKANPPQMRCTFKRLYNLFVKARGCTPVPEAAKAAALEEYFSGLAYVVNSTKIQASPRIHSMTTRRKKRENRESLVGDESVEGEELKGKEGVGEGKAGEEGDGSHGLVVSVEVEDDASPSLEDESVDVEDEAYDPHQPRVRTQRRLQGL